MYNLYKIKSLRIQNNFKLTIEQSKTLNKTKVKKHQNNDKPTLSTIKR